MYPDGPEQICAGRHVSLPGVPAKLASSRNPRRDKWLPMTTSLFWILWISNRRAMATGTHERLRNVAQQIDFIGF
jgi:hypothetical protein